MVFNAGEFQLPLIHEATLARCCLPIKTWLGSGSCGAAEIESKAQKREINAGRSTLALLSALLALIRNTLHQAGLTVSQSHVSLGIPAPKIWK